MSNPKKNHVLSFVDISLYLTEKAGFWEIHNTKSKITETIFEGQTRHELKTFGASVLPFPHCSSSTNRSQEEHHLCSECPPPPNLH